MPRTQKPLLVIGHKNPDTDSICSAIVYSRYKSEILHEEAVPRRAGNVNPQTQFVLSRFETDSPPLATDVRSRIDDIMIPREDLIILSENDTLEKACDLLTRYHFSFLPGSGRCGILRRKAHRPSAGRQCFGSSPPAAATTTHPAGPARWNRRKKTC